MKRTKFEQWATAFMIRPILTWKVMLVVLKLKALAKAAKEPHGK